LEIKYYLELKKHNKDIFPKLLINKNTNLSFPSINLELN